MAEVKLTKKGQQRREKILDAAERLFAQYGYDAVSTRQIAESASVGLAALPYYFDSKEELFRQVVARRAPEHLQAHHQLFDEAHRRACGKPPDIEALIEAITAPVMDRAENHGEGWRNYIRLICSLAATESGDVNLFYEHYESIVRRFVDGVRICLPSMSDEDIYISYHFLNSACLHMLQAHDTIDRVSNGLIKSSDYSKIVPHLAGFFSAGFYYMMMAKSKSARPGFRAETAPSRGRADPGIKTSDD